MTANEEARRAWEAQVSDSIRANHPGVFDFVEDDPRLPRVLLIGDSISIGYTVPVRGRLARLANVHRPAGNCASTKHSLPLIDGWLADGPWDVIHFNWGLHDVVYLGADGERVAPGQGAHQVPIAEYQRNLSELVARMATTSARLIWAATTPVPEGSAHRQAGDELPYNAVAAEIMARRGVPINDLHAYILPHLATAQQPANVHFTPEGYALLGERVAERIRRALAS